MVDKVGLTPQIPANITASDAVASGIPANPYTSSNFSSQVDQDLAQSSALLDIVTDTSQLEEPEQVNLGPQVLFSPSKQKMFVNGATFDIDDYQSALDAKQFLSQPTAAAPMDVAQDWIRVSPETFTSYIQDIKNPSTSTLMARNFEIGADNLKLLTGRGLQFYGKEETGKEWVDEALRDLYKNQPFQREFLNEAGKFDKGTNELVDWFVANLAQQGPMIFESMIVALAGGVVGGLAGGGANPFSAFGGTLSALAGKESFKQGVLAAAKKYSLNQPMTVAEKKLLREVSGMAGATKVKNDVFYNNPFTGKKNRAASEYVGSKIAGKAGATQARIGGAAGASLLGGQQLGQADIYGEVLETGVGDRGTAFLGSFPYAAAEVIPEFVLGMKVLGLNPAKLKKGSSALKRGPKSLIRRAGEGIAVGGALEGATELAQESILLGGTDQLGDAGTFRRLVNAFAAGFAIGGPIGGIANLKTDKAADVLNPEGNKDPEPDNKDKTTDEPKTEEGGQIPLFGPEVTSRSRDLRRNQTGAAPQPTASVVATPVVTPEAQPTPVTVAGDTGVTTLQASPTQDTTVEPNVQIPVPTGQGSLLTPTGRARNRRRQPAPTTPETTTATPTPITDFNVAETVDAPAPNPILQTVQQAGQKTQTPLLDSTPSGQSQTPVQPETDINNDLYKLKTGRTLSTLDQQELIAQRDRLIGKKKLTKREDKDLQAVTAAISRREANMTTTAEQDNRLQQIVNEQKQRDELNKQNAKILKQAERREAKRKKAEERIEAERIKQAEAQTKILENQAAATTTVATTEGGTQDAVQEQGTNEVVTQESTRRGKGVRERDEQPAVAETTGEADTQEQVAQEQASPTERQETKAEQLKRGRQDRKEQVQESTDRARQDSVVTPPKPTRDPAAIWASLGTVLSYDDISPELRQQFGSDPSFTRPEINIAKLRSKYTQLALREFDEQKASLPNAERLIEQQMLIEELEGNTTSDEQMLRETIRDMIDIAYGSDNPNPNANRDILGGKSERKFVNDFLLLTNFSDQQLNILREEFIDVISERGSLTYQTRGVKSDWAIIAEDKLSALDAIISKRDGKVIGLPSEMRATQEAVTDFVGDTTQEPTILTEELATQKLVNLIDSHISGKPKNIIINKTVTKGASKGKKVPSIIEIEDLFDQANPEFIMNGVKLKDYFDNQGNLNLGIANIDGSERFIPKPVSKKAAPSFDEIIDEADSETGDFYRYDGTKITQPVPKGKAQLIVKQVLQKLETKPKVTVVKNRDDLRNTNPKLYDRAVAAREDFATVNALGYSFSDQIIIFTDFIKDEQTLRSVIAHEALGHFGFSAFVPKGKLKLILDDIYESDPSIKAKANIRMNNGEERYEAIEEVLADYAAHVDSHILARFWNAVKNFISKAFGSAKEYIPFMTFSDEMTRYLVYQSRKNLRTGGSGVVTVRQMAKNIERIRNESSYGRYYVESSTSVAGKSLANQMINISGEPAGILNFKSFFDKAKQKGKKLYDSDSPKDVTKWFGKQLEKLQTLDNIALRSEGLSKIFALFQGQTARTRMYQQNYQDMTKFTHTLKNQILDKLSAGLVDADGPTNDELTQAGELLAFYALFKSKGITQNSINQAESLVTTNKFGERVINKAVFDKMKKDNMPSKEELENGFDVVLDILEDGTPNVNGAAFAYKPKFQITDRIYKIFEENRNTVNEAAKDLLETNLEAIEVEKQDILKLVRDVAENKRGIGSTVQDEAAAKTILNKYIEIYSENSTLDGVGISYDPESQKNAEQFLKNVNRALWEPKKLNDWVSGDTTEVPILERGSEQFTDVVNSLQQLHQIYSGNSTDAKQLTKIIGNLLILDLKNVNNEFNAKRTIMGAYVPFTRRGEYQVTLRAFDDNGNEIELDDHTKSVLPYYQVGSKKDARDLAQGLIEDFSDTKYKFKDKNLQDVEVNLRPETSRVGESAPLASSMNLNEFTSILVRLNINLKPEQMKKVTTALTKQSDRARRSLQRSGTGGWDTDVIRSVSEHLETMSHSAGKVFYSHKLNRYTTDNKLWMGDKNKLNRLKEKMESVERTGNDDQIKVAQQQYDSYANMYRYSAGDVTGETITVYKGSGRNREAVQVKTEGEGRSYRDVASGLVDYYGQAGKIDVSTEDFLAGEAGSAFKLLTVTSQLGGSVATGIINMVSMATHSVPFLATYNPKTGYGGGFGLMNSNAAMIKALRNVKNVKLEQLSHVREVAAKDSKGNPTPEALALQEKYGLTKDEAQVLLDATEQGVLQAAQFNALVGTARGGLMARKNLAGFVRLWMKTFSITEQLNRRTTFLAAYRLQRDKLQRAGDLSQSEIQKTAEEFALRAVNTSQGEYGMFNRPAIARGPILGLIMMYKQFVIITVELMRQLNVKEKAYMIGLILLMSGLKGLPFADDAADLADTLMQKLGIKQATVEKQLNDFLNELAPGLSPIVMRGLLDYYLGATMSTRLGFGDLVPLTGAGKAGSDNWQETKNFFGPVFSAFEQSVATMSLVSQQGAEFIGLKDETTSWADVLKNQPFGALRGISDGFTYLNDGAVTNKEGKVLMKEASTLQTIFRFLNFYPAGATYQNDIIRMSKQTDGYVKSIKKSYTDAWVKAKINKDKKTMRYIEKEIKEHNREFRGTEFEFRNWLPSARRAHKAWSMPAVERYKKFAPKNIRPETEFLLDAYESAINDY